MVASGANTASASTSRRIGEVVRVGADQVHGDGTDAVLAEEANQADFASDALEHEVAAAEVEHGGEVLLDLALDEGGEPFAHVAVIGTGRGDDALEVGGEGGVGAVGVGDHHLASLALGALDGPAHPPGLAAGAAAERDDELGQGRGGVGGRLGHGEGSLGCWREQSRRRSRERRAIFVGREGRDWRPAGSRQGMTFGIGVVPASMAAKTRRICSAAS